jgi:hypothetical protein
MSAADKIGLYGKGVSDVAKARADAKKATEHAAANFSKTKTFNCTVQPKPKSEKPEAEA